MRIKIKKLIYFCFALVAGMTQAPELRADEPAAEEVMNTMIELDPLFEYPVVPDSISSLQDRSDWLVTHFWDNFEFPKKKEAVGQVQLDHAFGVYATPMRFASKEVVEKSVDKLLSKIGKQPLLLLQFTKAAEDNLYSPSAEVWIDEVYLRFLESLLKNKKIKGERRARYLVQQKAISSTLVGTPMPAFAFSDPMGNALSVPKGAKCTLLIFSDPDSNAARIARLRLDTSSEIASMIENGDLHIAFIIPDASDGWAQKVAAYPDKWTVGAGSGLTSLLDIRVTPSFYLLDSDGNIKLKNATLNNVVTAILE